MSQPNIDYMMNMTKEFLSGKIDEIAYTLDFPYELEKRYNKMHREDVFHRLLIIYIMLKKNQLKCVYQLTRLKHTLCIIYSNKHQYLVILQYA